MVRVIEESRNGNWVSAPGAFSTVLPKETANRLTASTCGRARTLFQSKPGWLGSTVTVAGSVGPYSRFTAESPRRAPATAVRTVAVASAISRASSASERQRRGSSSRSQVVVIRMAGPPPVPSRAGVPHQSCRRRPSACPHCPAGWFDQGGSSQRPVCLAPPGPRVVHSARSAWSGWAYAPRPPMRRAMTVAAASTAATVSSSRVTGMTGLAGTPAPAANRPHP